MKKAHWFFIALSFVMSSANAEVKIEFPDEELATESVLPVFEETVAVKNRRVEHSKKFEINLMAGMVASEPIYNPFNFGASLTYHFTNTHAVHIMGVSYLDGLSSNGKSLKNGDVFLSDGSSQIIKFDASEAPHKNLFLGANYQYTAYYGKISISRDNIMNLTLAGLAGLGVFMMDGKTVPALNFGVSQRFYFSKSIALRVDVLFNMFSGPDITSGGPLDPDDGIKPSAGAFKNSMQFDSNVFAGLSILL